MKEPRDGETESAEKRLLLLNSYNITIWLTHLALSLHICLAQAVIIYSAMLAQTKCSLNLIIVFLCISMHIIWLIKQNKGQCGWIAKRDWVTPTQNKDFYPPLISMHTNENHLTSLHRSYWTVKWGRIPCNSWKLLRIKQDILKALYIQLGARVVIFTIIIIFPPATAPRRVTDFLGCVYDWG